MGSVDVEKAGGPSCPAASRSSYVDAKSSDIDGADSEICQSGRCDCDIAVESCDTDRRSAKPILRDLGPEAQEMLVLLS